MHSLVNVKLNNYDGRIVILHVGSEQTSFIVLLALVLLYHIPVSPILHRTLLIYVPVKIAIKNLMTIHLGLENEVLVW